MAPTLSKRSLLRFKPDATVYETIEEGGGSKVIAVLEGADIPVVEPGTIIRPGEVTASDGEVVHVFSIKTPDSRSYFVNRDDVEYRDVPQDRN